MSEFRIPLSAVRAPPSAVERVVLCRSRREEARRRRGSSHTILFETSEKATKVSDIKAKPTKLAAAATADRKARETRRLSTLLEVSQALSGTLDLKSALHRVLEILARHHGAVRSMVTLVRDTGELSVEASDGLDEPAAPVRYRVGEG